MKTPKFQKGDIILPTNKKRVKVIDVEVFDDLVLYYTDDKNAYPEFQINPFVLSGLVKLKYSQEERDRMNEDFLKSLR